MARLGIRSTPPVMIRLRAFRPATVLGGIPAVTAFRDILVGGGLFHWSPYEWKPFTYGMRAAVALIPFSFDRRTAVVSHSPVRRLRRSDSGMVKEKRRPETVIEDASRSMETAARGSA